MSDRLLDEQAFNDAFEANKDYKHDLDHHWLYAFVCYYESAKQHRNKHTLSPSLQQKGYDEPTQNSETGSGYILPSNASPVVMGKCLKCEEPTYANYHLCHTKTSDD